MTSDKTKTKLWRKYILPGILAAALPLASLPLAPVNAQDRAQHPAGLSWDGHSVYVGNSTNPLAPFIFDLSAGEMGAGFNVNHPATALSFPDINIGGSTTGPNSALIGYFFNMDPIMAGDPGETQIFRGNVQGMTTGAISVSNGDGFAIGAGFYDTLRRAVIANEDPANSTKLVRFTAGRIKVESTATTPDHTQNGAYGLIAREIGEYGQVSLVSVEATSTGRAAAVELSNILVNGRLTLQGGGEERGSVVIAGEKAYGVLIHDAEVLGDPGDMAGTLTIGTMRTIATGTAATGVDAESQAVHIAGTLSGVLNVNGVVEGIPGGGSRVVGGLEAYNRAEGLGAEAYGLWINKMEKVGLLPEDPSPSVNVTNIIAEGTGFAAGARFNEMTDGTVQIGTITVRDGGIEGAGVSGLYVRESVMGGSIDIGAIDAVGARYATGVDLRLGMDAGSELTVGNVTAVANNASGNEIETEANALWIQGNAAEITAGRLTATANQSAAGRAFGVRVSDIAGNVGSVEKLELDGDIAARGTDLAYGVFVAQDAGIILTNSINISAAGGSMANVGIFTGNDLELNVDRHALTIDSMWTGGNFEASGDGGSVTVEALRVGENLILGGGDDGFTFELDFGNPGTQIGNNKNHEAHGNLTIIANGEFINEDTLIMFSHIDDTVELIGGNPFTDVDWIYNNLGERVGIQSIGLRSDALINDGYLAAATIHNRYALWNAVRDRTISGNTHLGGGSSSGGIFRGALADPCEAASFCGPCSGVGCGSCKPRKETLGQSLTRTAETVTRAVGRTAAFIIGDRGNVWVNHIGRSDRYESWLNGTDWRTSVEGVQMGAEFLRTRQSQLGMVFGVERGNSYNWNQAGTSADRLKADDTYMGLYGVRVFRNGMDIRGVAGYGEQKYNMTRFGGNAANVSSFTGRTFDTNIDVGKRYTYGRWNARPMVGVDYSSNKLRGASEIGGSQAVSYGQVTFEQAFVRFGSDFYFQGKDYALRSGISYGYDFIDDKLYADLSKDTIDIGHGLGVVGTDIGQGLLMVNFGADVDITHTTSVFVGYDGQFRSSFRSSGTQKDMHIGYVGLNIKW